MKHTLALVAAAVLGIWVVFLFAQNRPANPVTTAARGVYERQSKNLLAAAEEMPEEKYGFKPTPEQMSFGTLIAHVAKANLTLCADISGHGVTFSPVTPEQGKSMLVKSLKDSFDSCGKSLTEVTDAKLGETTKLFGNRSGSKAEALLALTNDWADHYAAAAMYLRLNGLLPPTARKENKE